MVYKYMCTTKNYFPFYNGDNVGDAALGGSSLISLTLIKEKKND